MRKLFLFQRGKVLLRDDGSCPPEERGAVMADAFVNSGPVDRDAPNGDLWAELDPDAGVPD
ncbi:MAG: hypothetical protein Q4F74_00850 [Synergistaceae bacterium]|nr:hypothetical protein [Synergistaceae bacterium]